MTATLSLCLAPAAERVVPVPLGQAGTIELLLRPLSLGEELAASLQDDPMQFRIERSITGWRGAIDAAGAEIPYSPLALTEVVRQFPAARVPIALAVLGIEPRDAREKNSDPPSSDSCGTATARE